MKNQLDWKDIFPKENRYFETESGILYRGDCIDILKSFPGESINMAITSPPYWALRDYGVEGQLGLENTFQEYINKLCGIFDEVKKALKKDGTCWVNLGDSYGQNWRGGKTQTKWHRQKRSKGEVDFMGKKKPDRANLPDKCLLQIPSRFAIEMVNRGWILRNEIIWHKPNCMPSSVKDRFTVDFEKIFFFVKNKKYYFEQVLEKSLWADKDKRYFTGPTIGEKVSKGNYAINKGGSFRKDKMRNKRCVWQIPTKPFSEAHFAVYPPELIETPIKAGCPKHGIVLDIFMGAGTTALVCEKFQKRWIGIELNKEYCEITKRRIWNEAKQIKLF